jgi:hypothetical protein
LPRLLCGEEMTTPEPCVAPMGGLVVDGSLHVIKFR